MRRRSTVVRQVSTNGECLCWLALRQSATARTTSTVTALQEMTDMLQTPTSTPPCLWPSHRMARSTLQTSITFGSGLCALTDQGLQRLADTRLHPLRNKSCMCFNEEGLHLQTISLVTGLPLYNFSYGPDGELATLVDNCIIRWKCGGTGQGRGGAGLLRLILQPDNQVVTLGLDPAGSLRSPSLLLTRRSFCWDTMETLVCWPPRLMRLAGQPFMSKFPCISDLCCNAHSNLCICTKHSTEVLFSIVFMFQSAQGRYAQLMITFTLSKYNGSVGQDFYISW